MIIVSQNEDSMVILKNMATIYIENPLENDNGLFSIQAMSEADNITLGYYKTEERAKEVLKEISNKYEHSEHMKSARSLVVQDIIITDFVYGMPKE